LQMRKEIRDTRLSREAAARPIRFWISRRGCRCATSRGGCRWGCQFFLRLSVGRLMQALTRLDRDIEVTVRPKAAGCEAKHVSLVVQL